MIDYHPEGRHLSIPDHPELDRGTLRKLIRDAGITVEDFIALRGT
jgi:predicted RNA binding protein YcfA (HicA-like mRNA interferase family)